MEAPGKDPDEPRERASRLAVEMRQDPATKAGAIARLADQLGMHPVARRACETGSGRPEIEGGVRPGTTPAEAQRIAQVMQQVRELKRTNDVLKTSAALFAAAELERKIISPMCGSGHGERRP